MIAAISSSAAGALGLLAAVSLLALLGVALLAGSSARRGAIAERALLEQVHRPRLEDTIDAWLGRTRRGSALSVRLRAAGVGFSAARFAALLVLVALAAYLLASLLFPPVFALVAAGVAVWGCFGWLERKLDARRTQFVNQLPEISRLLANAASAGLSMPAGIEMTAREIEAPAGEELGIVVDEMRLGRSLDESLESLQQRLPSREVAILMTTIVIQQRAGGDVVRALNDLSNALDTRRDTLREIRTLMAGAVTTSYIVPLMGVGVLLLLNGINSNTLQRMTHKPLGIVALVLAGGMYALGTLFIRRTTRIEI